MSLFDVQKHMNLLGGSCAFVRVYCSSCYRAANFVSLAVAAAAAAEAFTLQALPNNINNFCAHFAYC